MILHPEAFKQLQSALGSDKGLSQLTVSDITLIEDAYRNLVNPPNPKKKVLACLGAYSKDRTEFHS